MNFNHNYLFQYTYDPHSYGVIQSVDHLGRTCSVKWFRTYTTGNEPQPLFVGTTLEPVYDLKDHPDFKYRPGSIVIRVANFNDMSDCTGGQVLDNYTSGQVLVWWANNTTSACWPQDLYKVSKSYTYSLFSIKCTLRLIVKPFIFENEFYKDLERVGLMEKGTYILIIFWAFHLLKGTKELF